MGHSYFDFLQESYVRVEIPKSTYDGSSLSTNFLAMTFFWACVVSLLHMYFSTVVRNVFSDLHNKLTTKKQTELSSYAIGLFHHCVVSPYCVYHMVSDLFIFINSGGKTVFESNHYDTVYSSFGIFPFTMGFFIADTAFYSVPELLKGNAIYMVHHCVAIITFYGILTTAEGTVTQLFPIMLSGEFSSIFFNTAWILRAVGFRDSILVTVLEALFALSFFALRNINVGLIMYAIYGRFTIFGGYQIAINICIALQYYWGVQIVRSLCGGRSKKQRSKKE